MVEKINNFLRFCLCIFENDIVKSDCPVQIFRKMIKYSKISYRLLVYLLLVLLFLEIKKAEILKKSSENDQLTGHFHGFFIYFFRLPDPKSEEKSRKSTNKKNLAIVQLHANTINTSSVLVVVFC